MALSIKNRETEALARELAAITQKPLTQAVHDALQREVKREKSLGRPRRDDFMETIREIQDRVAKLPRLDARSADEILYDEFGLPK